ncbi:MAG: thioredoxin domain-containing protein [Anaeromyxobacter sp.]|nr:thioredoxin domain-containing protein [Anaeromyxobacter sp.]MBL0277379.1 thioredoxin domain-containing protein [Anaeromyxobacter sp.]
MPSALPGSLPHPEPLARALAAALASRGPGYRPRTHHLDEDGRPRFTNRLALERSPYLLQHAHNPVDWWPWGEAAFAEARRLGRPVFLSVGYSTCHWCHVMEGESFEDETIARVLNGRYVAIKVDREERPDVDQLYMTAVQLLTGGGGWPMSVWLTPDKEPFFGGTYFPPRDGGRHGMRGFLPVLEEVAAVYGAEPERVGQVTASLTAAVRTALAATGAPADAPPGRGPIAAAVEQVARLYDPVHGGLQRAPKFPSSLPVRLLLRHHRRSGDPRALDMAVTTLARMAGGGLHDQLAGGFHRYATDQRWLVPHFEKMLYDNALLALAYAEAWQVTGRPDLARVARTTLDYAVRELQSPQGGFYSATDADSEGEEGRFFVWQEAEVRAALGDQAGRFCRFYDVTPGGNWEGANVLNVPRPDEAEWAALAPARATLLARRAARPPPLRDEKVLAAWNGLMISALAFGGRVLCEPRWVEAAARAAAFVLADLTVDGRLQRTWFEGRAGSPAFLDDHAFLAAGLLDLYEATFEPRWLAAALDLAGQVERRFGDPAGGGWFTTADDHERLLAREKPTHDGAEPSGASVALAVMLRLAAFTGDERWQEAAVRALRQLAPALEASPLSLTEALVALDLATDEVRQVVLVWPEGAPPPEPLLSVLRRTFLPSRALMGAPEGAGLEALARLTPVAGGKRAEGDRAVAYVCERGACLRPSTDPAALAAQLGLAAPDPAG